MNGEKERERERERTLTFAGGGSSLARTFGFFNKTGAKKPGECRTKWHVIADFHAYFGNITFRIVNNVALVYARYYSYVYKLWVFCIQSLQCVFKIIISLLDRLNEY